MVSSFTLIASITNHVRLASTFSIDVVTMIILCALVTTFALLGVWKTIMVWCGLVTFVTSDVFLASTFAFSITGVTYRSIGIAITGFTVGEIIMVWRTFVTTWKFNNSCSTLIALLTGHISIARTFAIFITRIIQRPVSIAHAI